MPQHTPPTPGVEFDGLGTHWSVELPGTRRFPGGFEDFIRDQIAVFGDTYSRFEDDSLVGQLNARKELHHPPQELLDMLSFAREMYEVTDGVFDISVGGVLQRLGYGDTVTATDVKPDFWSQVVLSKKHIRIPQDSAIDFGGFGRGWLLDKLAAMLKLRGVTSFVVNAGGDILVHTHEPINVDLPYPYDAAKSIDTIPLTRGAVAVSSTQKRQWRHRGTTAHHIIDPVRNHNSTSSVVSAYVQADTALLADTFATVLLIRPELQEHLEHQYGIRGRLYRDA